METPQFPSQMGAHSPNDVMKFITAMQSVAQQQEQHHTTASGHGHSHGNRQEQCNHSHGGHGGANRLALLKMMQEKVQSTSAADGATNAPMEQLQKAMADRHFEQSLQSQFHKMQKERAEINISGGYILQDPAGSAGPRESWLYGGGHYTPPVFGWGTLAKGFEDPQKNMPAAMDGSLFSQTGNEGAKLNNAFVFNVPVVGRLRYVKDRAGWIQSFIVLLYWIYGNFTSWNLILLPHYAEGHLSISVLMVYAVVSLLCITSFFRAVTTNPGTTPNESGSLDEPWTFCQACQKKRPPKAHHCRRCGQCVPMMDHHCPWINNCVGEENQWLFMQLVAYAYLLSMATLILDILYLSHLPPCRTCDPTSFIQVYNKEFMWVQIVLAVLMMGGGASLFLTQHMYVKTETSTLDWMKLQSEMQASGKMFDASMLPKQKKSMYETYLRVCGAAPCWLWPFPCRKRRPALLRHSDHNV